MKKYFRIGVFILFLLALSAMLHAAQKNKDVIILGLLKGSVFFCVDLLREMQSPDFELEFIKVK